MTVKSAPIATTCLIISVQPDMILQALKAKLHKETIASKTPPSVTSDSKIGAEVVSLTTKLPETWKCIHTLNGHSAGVNAIAISPQGNTFVSGSDDRTVNLWNLKTGKWLYTFAGQAEAVLSVAISPEGHTLASGSVDRKITNCIISVGWQDEGRKPPLITAVALRH